MNSGPGSEADPLDAVVESIVQRCRRGERPELTEYTARYPELAGRLREVFPALVLIEQVGSVGGAATLSPVPAATRLAPAARLGDYRILREVGRGGMGVVYEAVQESLGRHVALKVLPPAAARGSFLERFRREARAAARLHHTNIVPVFGVGEEDGTCYYAMQFIQGQGLDDVLDDVRRLRGAAGASTRVAVPSGNTEAFHAAEGLLTGHFDRNFVPRGEGAGSTPSAPAAPATEEHSSLGSQPETAYYRSIARLGVQAAEALAHAHGQGVLHRDVKPSNLLLDTQGTLWISDFGLAKAEDSADLTQTGDIVGTLRYMAPERFEGKADVRSDVYGLGLTLYELLTLRLPFTASDRASLIGQITRDAPPPPRRFAPLLPRDLETIVLKAMARDASARYASAAELADDLRRFLENRPIRARRSSPVERFRRWCGRNPAVASLAGAVALLLVLVTGVSVTAALQYRAQLGQVERAEQGEKAAKQEALAKLWGSYLAQARAGRMSRRPGQRFDSLRAIREALKLPLPEGRSRDELRTEAIACLLLPDLEVAREWPGWPKQSRGFAIDRAFARYARGDVDGTVSVRRLSDDAELWRLPGTGQTPDYDGLTFSPDGRFLYQACATAQGLHNRLWRLDGPAPITVLADYLGCAFSPDGRQLAANYPDGSIRLYDLDSRRELRRYPGNWRGFMQMCWNPRQRLLAVNLRRGYQILDLETGAARAEVPAPNGVSWMAWHPEGRLLAVSEEQQPVRIFLWDTTAGRLALPPLEGHKCGGVVVRFNHAGDRLLSTDWSGIWRLWDPRTGQVLLTCPAAGYWLDFSADDGLVAVEARAPLLRLLRCSGGQESSTVVHRRGGARTSYNGLAAFDPGCGLLAVQAGDGIALVDVYRGEEVALLAVPGNEPLHFEPSGALLTHGPGGVLRWPVTVDPKTSRRRYGPPQRAYPATGAGTDARADGPLLAFAPGLHGSTFMLGSGDNRAVPWGPQEDVRFCAVSPDGCWVATGSHSLRKGPGAKVWDARSGRHVHDLPVGGVCGVQFSPDGKWLLTTSGGPRLWSVGTWKEGPPLQGDGWGVFTAGGSLLALQDGPGLVRLVVPASGKEVARLTAPELTHLLPLCFTPDGTRLVCWGTESGALHVFDLRRIRAGLAALDLDWDAPPYPAALPAGAREERLEVEFAGADWIGDPAKMRHYQLVDLTLRLWANPLDAPAYLERGRLFGQEQAWPQAYADFDLAFRLDPRLSAARHGRALAACRLGRWQDVRADAGAGLLFAEADRRARAGQWKAAARDLSRGLELDPSNHWAWYGAALWLQMGDGQEFRRRCRQMLQRFGQTRNPEVADRVAKTCLLLPDAVPDLGPVLRLADRAVTGAEKHRYYAYFQLTKGLAEYRAGHFPQAIAWLRKADPGFPKNHVYARALTRLVLAMAYARGQPPESRKARAALAQAVQIMETRFPKVSAGNLGADWRDWLHCQVLRREAEGLLKAVAREAAAR